MGMEIVIVPCQQHHKPKPLKYFLFQEQMKKDRVWGKIQTYRRYYFCLRKAHFFSGKILPCSQCPVIDPKTKKTGGTGVFTLFSVTLISHQLQAAPPTLQPLSPQWWHGGPRKKVLEAFWSFTSNVNEIHLRYRQGRPMMVQLLISFQALDKALLWTTSI